MDSLVCQDNELLGCPPQLPRLGQELTRLTAILTRQSHRAGSPFPPVLKRKKVYISTVCSPGKISTCVPSLFVKDPGRCKGEKIQGLRGGYPGRVNLFPRQNLYLCPFFIRQRPWSLQR